MEQCLSNHVVEAEAVSNSKGRCKSINQSIYYQLCTVRQGNVN